MNTSGLTTPPSSATLTERRLIVSYQEKADVNITSETTVKFELILDSYLVRQVLDQNDLAERPVRYQVVIVMNNVRKTVNLSERDILRMI